MKSKKSTQKKSIGFGLLSFSLLFFANPNINIIDFLPDFIGYILLCFALSRLADMNESIGEAVSSFRKMILIDVGKWLALFWVFGLSVTTERNSSLLLWSFVFAVLEGIVLIPAYIKLFRGITELGYFYPNTSVLENSSGNKKSRTDKIRNATVFFVVLKATFAVLPELADLSNSAYDDTSSFVHIYQYIGTMRMLAFIPVLIVGVVWLIRALRYFASLRKDELFLSGLIEKYETQILPREGIFVRRNFKIAYILFTVALCFTVDFRVEYQNLFPDVFAAIFFFATLWFLQKNTAMKKGLQYGAAGVYFVAATLSSVSEYWFFSKHYYGAIIKSEEAFYSYLTLFLCNVFKALVFLFLIFVIIRGFYRVIETHTGYVIGKENNDTNEKKMIGSLQKELKASFVLPYVTAILYVVSDLAYDVFAPYFGFMAMINVAIALLCVISFVKALSVLRQAVDTKYMLS